MCELNEEGYLKLSRYIRKKIEKDPRGLLKDTFGAKEEDKVNIVNFMKKIEDIKLEIKQSKTAGQRNELNRKKGKALEELSNLLLDTTTSFDLKKNIRDHTNEIDILARLSDYGLVYKELLPKILEKDILIECKNYDTTIKVDWVGKFFSLMTTHKVDMGIIISYKEFAGNEWTSSKGLTKKIYLAENKAIININFEDIQKVVDGDLNVMEIIINKYDALKHGVDYSKLITRHPAEE